MDDVRGHFLGLPHGGTTPAEVTTNKNITSSSFSITAAGVMPCDGRKSIPFILVQSDSVALLSSGFNTPL